MVAWSSSCATKVSFLKLRLLYLFFFCEFINYNFVKFHGLSVGPVSMFELPDKDLKDGLYKQNLPLKILSIKKAEEWIT